MGDSDGGILRCESIPVASWIDMGIRLARSGQLNAA